MVVIDVKRHLIEMRFAFFISGAWWFFVLTLTIL